MPRTVRWMLVLPAAVLGYSIAQLATILIGLAFPTIVTQEFGALTTPVGFVLLGARVAPSRRTQTAGVLAILSFLAHGMVLAVVLLHYRTTLSVVGNLVAMALGVLGTVAGLYLVYRQEHRTELIQVE